MGNFEKLGILVIIVLVVVILVLAVWGMGVPPDPQDGDHVLSGKAARAGNNAGGDAAKKDPKTVEIGKTSAGKDGLDHWLKPQDNASEPKVDQGKKLNEEPGSKKDTTSAGKDVEHTIVRSGSRHPDGRWLMDRWLQSFPYHINVSILVLILSGFLVVIIALLSVSYQTVRASLVNPASTLRYE